MFDKTKPLSLSWSFGINKNIHGEVHNISDANKKCIFYTATHTGIVYDFVARKQVPLQGHSNCISSTCVSSDRKWLTTGDAGKESMIIVWDATNCKPTKTVFDPHQGAGVSAMDMSPDSKYLVSLSASVPQEVTIYDWAVPEGNGIICSEVLNLKTQLTSIKFNPEDSSILVATGEQGVLFITWTKDNMTIHTPMLNNKDFEHTPKGFTYSTFIPCSTQAVTGTSEGDVVIWDNRSLNNLSVKQEIGKKTAIKYLKLYNSAVTYITSVKQKYMITGGDDGIIKVYDLMFRLMTWFEKVKYGPIRSVSFTSFQEDEEEESLDEGFSMMTNADLPDMVVSTKHAKVLLVEKTPEKKPKVQMIMEGLYQNITSMSTHPSQPLFAITGKSGMVQIWDYSNKELKFQRRYDHEELHGESISYCANGTFLAVGFSNGTLKVLKCDMLEKDAASFSVSKWAIQRIVFSSDSIHMACSDTSHTIALFRRDLDTPQQLWQFIGKYKAHHQEVTGLLFQEYDRDKTKLISVSMDRRLVEYDLEGSSISKGVKVKTTKSLEQTSHPLAAIWIPIPKSSEKFLLCSNSSFKFRFYNSVTFHCRKTVLGPTFGGCIKKMVLIPPLDNPQYLAFASGEKVIGISKLPLDGNPNRNMGLIAHHGEISHLCSSYDGQYLFTAGGEDCTVHMWNIRPSALEAQLGLRSHSQMACFYDMLDPLEGAHGEMYREMEDYFYYSQLLSQGEDTTDKREISMRLKIQEIPAILQAFGYYPSMYEIQDILNEIKFANVMDTSNFVTDISFDDLIKLYLNHRPVETYTDESIVNALQLAKTQRDGDERLTKRELIQFLQEYGEPLLEQDFDNLIGELLLNTPYNGEMPEKWTPEEFIVDILGMGVVVNSAAE